MSGPLAPGRRPVAVVAVIAAVAVLVAAGLVVGVGRPSASPGAGPGSPSAGSSAIALATVSPTGTSSSPIASAGSSPSSAQRSPTAGPTARPTPGPTPRPTPTATRIPAPAPTPRPAVPAFAHVYVIVMENEESNSIVNSPDAPYINSLIKNGGLANAYDAVAHPSEPNYLALFSGSTQGMTDDSTRNFSKPNLADQLDAHGRTWRVFAQNDPSNCYTGDTASGGPDGSPGDYARKHNPAISFTDISGSPSRCARITDFSHFSPAAANFEFIVPNLCNDMHDCSVATGDAFLRGFVPRITGSSSFANSVLFITWDEGGSDLGGGGRVATIVVSPHVRPGTISNVAHSHYSLLRTIEDAWGLGCLNNACQANDMREFFTR